MEDCDVKEMSPRAVLLVHIPTGLTTCCWAYKSESKNRAYAREVLAEKVERAERKSENA